jgi:hypothetical protein
MFQVFVWRVHSWKVFTFKKNSVKIKFIPRNVMVFFPRVTFRYSMTVDKVSLIFLVFPNLTAFFKFLSSTVYIYK